ncbi:sigma-54 dependent transcriptional regulator [Burkholderiaceae bacterium DAT-1]|nr:sigma-54 dependent transcriptional regulator [Burkholderiaceae bacterium DAT-1]
MASMSRLNLIGSSLAFRQMQAALHRFAGADATVLINGESGTGKELAARSIHYLSARSEHPFVPVNCGVLTDSLMESELFGHERGAFTDASRQYAGLIGEADGGTLFLDEIDSLSPRAQGALLRFLQEKTYRKVGGTGLRSADVRVVAATNADLAKLAAEKQFRHDLLYRLNVLQVTVPPLRDRGHDAVELAQTFVARLCDQYQTDPRLLSESARVLISRYSWPGNIRKLENLLLRDFLMSDGPLLECAELGAMCHLATHRHEDQLPYNQAKAHVLLEFERRYVSELIARTGGNVTHAARLAGKERSAFGKLLRKHGLRGDTQAAPPAGHAMHELTN